jgi:hypothetical protein
VLLRLPAVFLDELRGGPLVETAARLQHVHHQEPEHHGDRHVGEEQRERRAGERPEVRQLAELHDAVRQRREHQRDHHEEQHAQEDLAERIADRRGEPLRPIQNGRGRAANGQHHDTGCGTQRETEKDAIREPGVRVAGHAGC